MTCEELEQQLTRYLAGEMPDTEAERLEWHAAHCARCEVRLEQASRLSTPLVVDVTSPRRRDTLDAVALQSASVSTQSPVVRIEATSRVDGWRRRSWRTTAVVLATAAALVVLVSRRQPATADHIADATSVSASGDSSPATTGALIVQGSGMQRIAAQLASEQAQQEFLALDDAARELESALESAPSDRELRTYLSTVRARRDELSRRVREATS